jgi:hypothetical protein
LHENERAQKETEQRHVLEFLARSGIAATVEGFGDRPDAVLLVDGRRVGLEHSELTEPTLAQNADNLMWFEPALERELSAAHVAPDITVSVIMRSEAPVLRARRQVDALASAVAAFAARRAPQVVVDEDLQVRARDLLREGVEGVDVVSIARHDHSLEDGPWAFVSNGHWGPGDSTALAAVRRKEQRLHAYAGDPSLSEIWLLLVTGDHWTQSTDSALTRWTKVESGFARVYLLDLRIGELQRLDAH